MLELVIGSTEGDDRDTGGEGNVPGMGRYGIQEPSTILQSLGGSTLNHSERQRWQGTEEVWQVSGYLTTGR